jgi:hypothetical protein
MSFIEKKNEGDDEENYSPSARVPPQFRISSNSIGGIPRQNHSFLFSDTNLIGGLGGMGIF